MTNYCHFNLVQTRFVELDCGVDSDLQDVETDSKTAKILETIPENTYLATSAGSVSQHVL